VEVRGTLRMRPSVDPQPPFDKFLGVLNFWLNFTASGLYAMTLFSVTVRAMDIISTAFCSGREGLQIFEISKNAGATAPQICRKFNFFENLTQPCSEVFKADGLKPGKMLVVHRTY